MGAPLDHAGANVEKRKIQLFASNLSEVSSPDKRPKSNAMLV